VKFPYTFIVATERCEGVGYARNAEFIFPRTGLGKMVGGEVERVG